MKVFGLTIMSCCQTKIGDNSLPWKFWNYIRPKTVLPVSFSSQGFKFQMIRQITLTPEIDKDHLVQLSIKEMMWHRIIFTSVIFHCPHVWWSHGHVRYHHYQTHWCAMKPYTGQIKIAVVLFMKPKKFDDLMPDYINNFMKVSSTITLVIYFMYL